MLPVLAYLGLKAVSTSEVDDYKAKLSDAWRDFSELDIKPFKKSVDSGAILGTSSSYTESTIGDVLGTPDQMKKLAPYVELRNRLVKSYAALLAYCEKYEESKALFGDEKKISPESAMAQFEALEESYRQDRSDLSKVRKLVSLELPSKGPGPLAVAGAATGMGLLVYGIYRLIKRATDRSTEPWR